MNPQIILVSLPQIDWSNYLISAKYALDRSITEGMDDAKRDIEGGVGFLGTISSIKNSNDSPIESIRVGGSILRHVSISFFFICAESTIIEIIKEGRISVTYNNAKNIDQVLEKIVVGIASANLEDWKQTFINLCSDNSSKWTRVFVDKCLLLLEKDGYGEVFANFSKESMPDKSFKLIEKKK